MRILAVCIFLGFIAFGCKKNEVIPNVDNSTKYYPIEDDYTWTYEVDSIIYYGNITQKPDTLTYWVRHTVKSSGESTTGARSFIVEKSIRTEIDEPFIFNRTFEVLKTSLELEYNSIDTRIPILLFPITNDKEWSGNLYTEKDEWNIITGKTNELQCYYTDVHSIKTIENVQYDSTSTVIRSKEQNAINSRYSTEIYGANIGLVSKYFENLENFNTTDPKGSIYTYTLISFEN